MQIGEFINFLETLAPPALQEDYDNSGLQIGDLSAEFSAALLCMDITEDIIDEARQKKVNLIISHHPLLFKGIKQISASDQQGAIIFKAIQHGIVIYSMHTNLDNIPKGVNYALAKSLGLENLRILEPMPNRLSKLVTYCPVLQANSVKQALFDAGCGQIGNYDSCSFSSSGTGSFRALDGARPFVGKELELHEEDEIRIETIFPNYLKSKVIKALLAAHPYEEVAYDIFALKNDDSWHGAGMMGVLPRSLAPKDFLQHVKASLGLNVIRHSDSKLPEISRVAVCGGSGSFLIRSAMQQKADALLTADIKYHQFQEPGKGMLLCDLGHFESERLVMPHLASLLAKKFPNFAILVSERDQNPVKIFI